MANQNGILLQSQDGSGNYEDHQRVLTATDTLVLVAAMTANLGVTIVDGFNLTGAGALGITSGGANDLSLGPANDLVINLSDAVGARSVLIKDSGAGTVFSIDSDGNVVAEGTMTINGGTTTVEGTLVTYEDSLLLFAKDQAGAPTVDVGFIGERGTSTNVAFVWDESADTFVCVTTTDTGTNTTLQNISDYADLRVGALVADDSVQIAGGPVIVSVLDEDAMGSDSATSLATQQSIKAYVDSQVGGTTFSGLTDTTIAAPAGGHIAVYDGTDSWDNKPLSGDATLSSAGVLALAASNTNQTSIANLVTVGALASGSIANGFGGIAMNDAELLLTGSANAQLGDSVVLSFGTGDDVQMRWDGTDLDVLGAADNQVWHWGVDNGNAFDMHWHGEAIGDAVVFDASANTWTMSDVDLILDNGALFTFGGIGFTTAIDDDTMASASATSLATSESIKAYVDSAILTADTFAEMTDTNIVAPSGGQFAVYDGTDSWDNVSLSGDVASVSAAGAVTLSASIAAITTLSNLVTVGALASGSIANGFGGIAMNDAELLLTGSANAQLGDSVVLSFGTGDDVQMRWDGTDLDVLGAADNQVWHWGVDNGNAFDMHWHGDAAGDAMVFDASANTFTLSDIDLTLDNAAKLTIGDGSEQLYAGYTAAGTNPAANNLLFAVVDDTGMKARLLDVTSTLATSRCGGVWRTGGLACKHGRCTAVLLENEAGDATSVGCTIGDQLVGSARTNGRVTTMGATGAPAAAEYKVVVGWAEETVGTGSPDVTCKASLHIQPPVLL